MERKKRKFHLPGRQSSKYLLFSYMVQNSTNNLAAVEVQKWLPLSYRLLHIKKKQSKHKIWLIWWSHILYSGLWSSFQKNCTNHFINGDIKLAIACPISCFPTLNLVRLLLWRSLVSFSWLSSVSSSLDETLLSSAVEVEERYNQNLQQMAAATGSMCRYTQLIEAGHQEVQLWWENQQPSPAAVQGSWVWMCWQDKTREAAEWHWDPPQQTPGQSYSRKYQTGRTSYWTTEPSNEVLKQWRYKPPLTVRSFMTK